MITKEWTEAETLAVLNGVKEETEENWLEYSENFFYHELQDRRRNNTEMERILCNLEASAKVGNERAGAVLGFAVVTTFVRRQVVEDGLSYLTRAARLGIAGAAEELCAWYSNRIVRNDLDSFEDVDVGVDDCYSPTSEHPRVQLPSDLASCVIRIWEVAGWAAREGRFGKILDSVCFALSLDDEIPGEHVDRFESALLSHCEKNVDERAVSYAVLRLWGERRVSLQNSVKILETEAALGSVSACSFLGKALFEGIDGVLERDDQRAIALLSKAVEADNVLAKYHLALCYEEGRGVEKDEVKSAQLLQEAAEAKVAPALVKVGRMLVEGATDEKKNESVRRGCQMIRYAAEEEDYPPAWEAILEYHDRKIGPFKTNKFARAAREALKNA